MDTLIGRTLSHYRIVERIGAGGMGEVYRARDTRLERDVAIKALPEAFSSDPERLSRFIREAKVLASLNHPNIGAIYGFEELPSGGRFLILELVEGETLADRVERGPLPLAIALEICDGIAEALEAAHERGVVHRDLKPRNVMLPKRGGVKVLDFGLARRAAALQTAPGASGATGSLVTEAGVTVGTPGYMSPEQVRGEEQDARTDIFAFGCVLYECLTGQRAFGGKTAMDAMAAVLATEPVWSALPPGTPQSIRSLLARCVEKGSQHRLGNIADARTEMKAARGLHLVPAATVSAAAHNLPSELSSFVGRERELSECGALLAIARLLTLTGAGGCGKTRLAIKVTENRQEAYPDGVWFVDLAPLSDPERVPDAIAAALDIRQEQGKSIMETLARELADRRMLLVLDNCEHLLMACATLSERLLTCAPELQLLATSREALGVKGERPYLVGSLSLPSPESERDLQAIAASEAVRLFLDRAQVVAPEFRLTESTASVVAEICRRLDGIPLAVELAAARVRMLSVDQIRAKLDDRFRLLTGGSKTALVRQQTLRAAMQWSYDFLTEEEQRLFGLLAVFAGGWTLDGATAVGGAAWDEFEALDLLTRLVDKSLVTVERGKDGVTRYGMLETVREYARERLNESNEEETARARHLDYYLALAEEAGPLLNGPEAAKWLVRLDRELQNMLSAHAWCDRAEGGGEKGLRLLGAVNVYWSNRGLYELGLRALREALRRPGAEERTAARARAVYVAGALAHWMGLYGEGQRDLEESVSISRALDDRLGLSRALGFLAAPLSAQGNYTEGRRHLEECLALVRELGLQRNLGAVLGNLAFLDFDAGDLDSAGRLYVQALAVQREHGNLGHISRLLCEQAWLMMLRGDLDSLRGQVAEAAKLAQDVGSKELGQLVLDTTSALSSALRDFPYAARLWGASEKARETMGLQREPLPMRFMEPRIALARKALGDAEFSAAEAAGRALRYDDAMAETRAWLGDAAE